MGGQVVLQLAPPSKNVAENVTLNPSKPAFHAPEIALDVLKIWRLHTSSKVLRHTKDT